MIYRLSFGNYKSYFGSHYLEFALPSNGIGMTILVGENNSGKSSVLKILSDALSQRHDMVFDKLDRHGDTIPELAVELQALGNKLKVGLKQYSSAQFKKLVKVEGQEQELEFSQILQSPEISNRQKVLLSYIPSRRPWTDDFNASSDMRNSLEAYEQHEANSFRVRQSNITLPNLGDYLNGILRKGEKDAFDSLIQEVLPGIVDWSTDRIAENDKIVYRSGDGKEHALGKSGDGVLSVFRICYSLHSYRPEVPLVIDEPELSLHPEAQRKLYQLLKRVSKSRQIIFATHSPHFIDWRDIAAGAKIYRITKGADGRSIIRGNTESTARKISAIASNDKRNRKLFDYLAKEVVFQNAAVFLEGQEDVHIISSYLEDQGKEQLPLFSYGSGGASNIDTWLDFCAELGIYAVGVYDGDKEAEYKRTLERFSSNKTISVLLLPREDIRDKTVEAKIKKSGFFDSDWQVKPAEKEEFDRFLGLIYQHTAEAGRSSLFSRSKDLPENVVSFAKRETE